MKEVKYIPLDLVKADKNPNIIWKVKDVSQDKRGNVLYRVVAAEDNDAFIYLYEHQIASVPLTPEILEKNGWFEDSFLDSHKSFYQNDRRYPSLHGQNTQNGYAFDIDIGETNIMTNVKYIHELQHLLFGLGINHEMEV
jgi:hypothetical protein|nr:hypothetical protein [uncultured Prevotella sp.]DAV55002.1 MAG TPA: hypothetical protein [Caudoviricetes sp.]